MLSTSTLIIGLGESGLAMARFLATQHAEQAIVGALTVLDSREDPPGLKALSVEFPQVRVVTAPLDAELALGLLAQHDQVAWSPGLSIHHGQSAVLYRQAFAQGKPVVGELDLFAAALEQLKTLMNEAPAGDATTH